MLYYIIIIISFGSYYRHIIYYNMYLHCPLSLSLARFFLYSTRSSLTRTTMKIYTKHTLNTHILVRAILYSGALCSVGGGGSPIRHIWRRRHLKFMSDPGRFSSERWRTGKESEMRTRERLPLDAATAGAHKPRASTLCTTVVVQTRDIYNNITFTGPAYQRLYSCQHRCSESGTKSIAPIHCTHTRTTENANPLAADRMF